MRESKKARAERVDAILARLDAEYGTEYRCYLDHETPWQLLIAVILSAQCTDARVNIVTKELFKKIQEPGGFCGGRAFGAGAGHPLHGLLSHEGKKYHFLL